MTAEPGPFYEREDRLTELDIILIRAYRDVGVPVDWLPYTDEFDKIYDALKTVGDTRNKAQVFRRLLNLRKSGRLPPVQLGLTG
jgi:hypothetical protein